jgi:L-rhamnose-H+ transport protein
MHWRPCRPSAGNREWRASSGRTRAVVWAGIALLVGGTMVIGYGNYLAAA